ncbi:MAG: SoxR reducing system RseC family protein, partial [Spirochaetota bacterium]
MTERAQVLSVDGAIATVRCDTTESCSSCSSILCNPRSRTYEASWDPIAARLAPGDWVEVEVTERGALGKGLLLFALPIVLFVVFYLGLGTVEIDPESAEVVRVAGGFAGLAGGFGLAVLASRLWQE